MANTGHIDVRARKSAPVVVVLALLGLPAMARAEGSVPPDAARWAPVLEQRGVAVVENRRALPRAWLVSEVRSASAKQALRTIRGETREAFDPRKTALVELGEAPLPKIGKLSPGDTAKVLAAADGKIVVDTHAARPGFLVVSETYFPGWVATVDGAEVPIYQTDYLLLGVAIPPGAHRVEMRYRAPRATLGLMISSMTALTLIGLGVVTWRRSRAARRSANTGEGAAA